MEKNGLLSVAQRHIPGGKQRKRVYTLTEPGREMANSLAERVLSEQVKQGDSTTALSEVWNRNEPILELLSRVDEALILQDAPLVSPVSNPHGMASMDAQNGEDLVRRMYARAWEDGKITRDEQSLLNEVVEFLGMHPERVRRLSNEARKSLKIPPPEEVYFEMILQALDDGEILQDEIDLLDTFRVHFGIDQVTHHALLNRARNTTPVSEHYQTYAAAVKTAMKDKVITADEHAILKTLRGTLDITDQEHESIMNELTEEH